LDYHTTRKYREGNRDCGARWRDHRRTPAYLRLPDGYPFSPITIQLRCVLCPSGNRGAQNPRDRLVTEIRPPGWQAGLSSPKNRYAVPGFSFFETPGFSPCFPTVSVARLWGAWRETSLDRAAPGGVALAPLRIEIGPATQSRRARSLSQQGFLNRPGWQVRNLHRW
jgi:hypothetical protein